MRGVLFFVCLCFLLLKGNDSLCIGVQHTTASTFSTRDTEKKEVEKLTNVSPHFSSIGPHYDNKEALYFICEEVEEEDDDNTNTSARKNKSFLRGSLSYAHPYIITYLCDGAKDAIPFSNHLSYKYISQRALRI
jgi:uncharacterized protein YlaI